MLELDIRRIVAELVVGLRRVGSFVGNFESRSVYLFLQKWNATEEKQNGRSEDWTENPGDIFVVEMMRNHGVKLHDDKLEDDTC